MERGYGTGVWNGCGPGACSGPPILTCTHIYMITIHTVEEEEILHQLVTIGNYEALFTSWDHNGMFTIIAIYQLMQDFATSIHSNCQ